MAFIDFTAAFRTDVHATAAAVAPAPRLAARLSPLEWSVVALARRDSLAGLRQPGRLARALGGLFGLGAESRLADPRLEALRRVAVHGWHDPRGVPAEDRNAFLDAGFSAAHLDTLLASIAAGRQRSIAA